VADTAAAFIACADSSIEGANVFNLHGETVAVERIASYINQQTSLHGCEPITFGGPPIPIAPSLNDAAIRQAIGNLPSTPLESGIQETMQRFAALRDAGRLDVSDIET
jgi:nucleoside-diphosphate-sugar epimerase